ncbi:hypothetical protein FCULG_00002707, partial [Fusarium culmorum]
MAVGQTCCSPSIREVEGYSDRIFRQLATNDIRPVDNARKPGDVSHSGQEQSGAISWCIVPRVCRDDEVGVMEKQEQHLEESVSLAKFDRLKAKPAVVATKEDASVITALNANLKMCLKWNGVLTVIKAGSSLLYLVSRPVMVVEAFVGLRAMEPARHKIYELTII